MPLALLVIAFIVVPIAELYVIVAVVGDAIGLLPTLALLIADSVLGSLLLRSQGRAAWRRFTVATSSGRVPHREVLDGALIIFGGALLITPGFITDIVGILLLLPPTRALVRRALARTLARRMVVGVSGAVFGGEAVRRGGDGAEGRRRPYDVEGSASEVPSDPADSPLPRLQR